MEKETSCIFAGFMPSHVTQVLFEVNPDRKIWLIKGCSSANTFFLSHLHSIVIHKAGSLQHISMVLHSISTVHSLDMQGVCNLDMIPVLLQLLCFLVSFILFTYRTATIGRKKNLMDSHNPISDSSLPLKPLNIFGI